MMMFEFFASLSIDRKSTDAIHNLFNSIDALLPHPRIGYVLHYNETEYVQLDIVEDVKDNELACPINSLIELIKYRMNDLPLATYNESFPLADDEDILDIFTITACNKSIKIEANYIVINKVK